MIDISTAWPAAFSSFAELRAAHEALLARRRIGGEKPVAENVATLLEFAKATGTTIEREGERQAAQNILDYWAAELITLSAVNQGDWSPPRLADYQPRDAGGGPVESAAAPAKDLKRDRERIRIAAAARQWRASGMGRGYLLRGKALEEALPYADTDRDIADLVRASQATTRRWQRIRIAGVVLIVGVLSFLWLRAENALSDAENERRAVVAAKEAADFEVSNARTNLTQAAVDLANAQERLAERVREQEATQRNLDAAAVTLREAIDAGRLEPAAIPDGIRPMVDALARAIPPPDLLDQDLAGYDAAFLGPELPLPRLSEGLQREAAGADPVRYLHYSLMLSGERRLALFTASNLDRDRLAILPQPGEACLAQRACTSQLPQLSPFLVDRRLAIRQEQPRWSNVAELVGGRLVTAQEIAWGPEAAGDPSEAANRLAAVVDVYPNIVPQFLNFREGLWSGLDRYARTEFSVGSPRVSLFSGPVFAEDDQRVDDIPIPQHFWKILVGVRPDKSAALIAEAYLLPQFGPDGAGPTAPSEFIPDRYRVRVSDIEALTGLDFREAIRQADTASLFMPRANLDRGLTVGDQLASLIVDLDAAAEGIRTATTERMAAALRDGAIDEAEQQKVLGALLGFGRERLDALSEPGRINVLSALSEVPAASWRQAQPAWPDLRASARRFAAEFDAAGFAGEPQAGRLLAALKERLGWSTAQGHVVYFQFAGMTRETAVETSAGLKALGWSIPGEERTAAAAAQNEVRYRSDADAAAADLLAADLRALGWMSVRASQNGRVTEGTMEIWISE